MRVGGDQAQGTAPGLRYSLSPRQRAAYRACVKYAAEHGSLPRASVLGKLLGLHESAGSRLLGELADLGWLVRHPRIKGKYALAPGGVG